MECVFPLLEFPVFVWECGWRHLPPGTQGVIRPAIAQPISGTSFSAFLFTSVHSLSSDRNSHIPVHLLSVLPLCLPLASLQCDQVPIWLLEQLHQHSGHDRMHRTRQKTIAKSKGWDTDVLHRSLGNIHLIRSPSWTQLKNKRATQMLLLVRMRQAEAWQ